MMTSNYFLLLAIKSRLKNYFKSNLKKLPNHPRDLFTIFFSQAVHKHDIEFTILSDHVTNSSEENVLIFSKFC